MESSESEWSSQSSDEENTEKPNKDLDDMWAELMAKTQTQFYKLMR